ncbi:hypothetical protein GCM10023205_66170 [Yinghuangia aomiensis]|uniref:Uncharacterized protein n=1 Tax=Yinghuangia aomiensis TaxID=676205 RepID=A0ABP9I2S3_9ACTN
MPTHPPRTHATLSSHHDHNDHNERRDSPSALLPGCPVSIRFDTARRRYSGPAKSRAISPG